MTIELGLLFGAVACVIGAATFFLGRLTYAKHSGQEWGEMKTDIKHIKEKVDEMTRSWAAALGKEESERREADRRLHTRIDEHITMYHSAQGAKT